MTQAAGSTVRVARFGLIVSDLSRLADFYCGALGCEAADRAADDPALAAALGLADRSVRTLTLRLGQEIVELNELHPGGAPYPAASTAHDPWFQHLAIVVAGMAAAYQRLSRFAPVVAVSQDGPQRLPPSAGAVTAFKFRDPDGHPLELLAFPPGGSARWQDAAADARPLGIDHTAVVVADTGRSVDFYERLGFVVSHRSLNRGPEQQRLDALPGVEVAVTALRPGEAAGAGIELLQYRSVMGRAQPVSPGAEDIASTRVCLAVDDLNGLLAAVAGHHLVHVEDRCALLRDPDGHLLLCSAGLRSAGVDPPPLSPRR